MSASAPEIADAASARRESEPSLSDRQRARLVEALGAAQAFYASRRSSSWVPEYLSGRRLDISEAGYAPGGGSTLRKALLAEGFTDDELRAAGLVRDSSRGDSMVDRFKARLMLPIRDGSGVLVGFVGRVREGARGPKYMNSPTSPLFVKSSVLMGLAEGADALREGATAVFVEGPMDRYAVTGASTGAAVGLATGGTALTAGHLAALGEIVDLRSHPIAYATDDDEAGIRAAAKGWELLAAAGVDPARVRRVPLGGHDPASLLQADGADALAAAVLDESAPLLVDVYADAVLARWSRHMDNALARVDALREVARNVSGQVDDEETVTAVMGRLATRHEMVDTAEAAACLADVRAGAAAPAESPAVEPAERGNVANLDDYRSGGGHGGSGGDGGDGSGGDGGSPQPLPRITVRDRFENADDGIYKLKYEKERVLRTELLPVSVRLTGRIVEDLCDGSPATMTHVDLAAESGGETHELHAVDLDRWKSCSWVNELPWGATFNDTAQGRSTLRNAIVRTSGLVQHTTMYGVLGWQKIAGRWVYLHAGGGIDAQGAAADIRVKVPAPLEPFELPEPPSTVEGIREAVVSSTALLDVVPARVAAPLLGSAYRACLGTSRVTVMPFGPKGWGKTGVAANVAQHYAPSARYDRMPGAGAGEDTGGTGFALEELRFRAGDVLLPLDDLAPDRGTERASVRCALIARSQFNRQAKMRGTRTGGLRPQHLPRSLPLVTGEETTTVESAESRIVTLRVSRGDVNSADLKQLDAGEVPVNRARLTAAMVRHFAPAKDTLDEWLRETRSDLTESLADAQATDPGVDTRHAESVADLATGWRAMLDMAVRRAALTEAEAEELWGRAWAGLTECKRELMSGAARRTPADRVRELLRTLLVQRRVTLRATDGQSAPEEVAAACGWEPDLMVADGWRERGDCIGWTDGNKVWLVPGAAHGALTSQARREEDPLTYTGRGLGEVLAACEVIRTEEAKGIRRTSVRAPRIGVGKAATRPRVWELGWSWLFADDEEGAPSEPPPSAPTAPSPVDVEDASTPTESDLDPPASETANPVPSPAVDADQEPAPVKPPRRRASSGRSRRAERGASLEVEPAEVREVQEWAGSVGESLSDEQAAAAVERFHLVTGCRWKGAHGTIRALLSGHTKWPGAKAPETADLGLFNELRKSDQFWSARSWMLTPGDPAENASIAAADVDAQYVAAASSVELGIGDPVHYEPGDSLPEDLFKLPGWGRLASEIEDAPNGLTLPEGMWVPTPLAVYLHRNHGRSVPVSEALVWHHKRKALESLARHFRNWLGPLKADDSEAGRYARGMVKTTYTKALGGYLASEKGLTSPEWHRPDWAMLLRAVAEANELRALDRLPKGCTPRAKYADAAFIEVAPEADLTVWDRLNDDHRRGAAPSKPNEPVKPGRWKLVGQPVAARPFCGLRPHADAWRTAYEDAQPGEVTP